MHVCQLSVPGVSWGLSLPGLGNMNTNKNKNINIYVLYCIVSTTYSDLLKKGTPRYTYLK